MIVVTSCLTKASLGSKGSLQSNPILQRIVAHTEGYVMMWVVAIYKEDPENIEGEKKNGSISRMFEHLFL